MYETLTMICKTISLLMFFPFFVGVAVWALQGRNKAAYAQIPLRED